MKYVKTYGRKVSLLVLVFMIGLVCSAVQAAWPEMPTHKTYVFPGFFPRNGQGDYSSSGFDVGQVRNMMETTYEGWWREYSYYRANPTNGVPIRGYYMDTKTVGEISLPWAWNPGNTTLGVSNVYGSVLGTVSSNVNVTYSGVLSPLPARGYPLAIQIGTRTLTDTAGIGVLQGDGSGTINMGTGAYSFQLSVAAPEGTPILINYAAYIQGAAPSPGSWANFSAGLGDAGDARFPDGRGEHFDEVSDPGSPGVLYQRRIPGTEDIVDDPLVDGFWTPGERFIDSPQGGGAIAPNGYWDPYVHAEDRWTPVHSNITGTALSVMSLALRNYIDSEERGDFFYDYDFSVLSVSAEAEPQVITFDGLQGLVSTNVEVWIADRGRRVNVQVDLSEFDLTPPLYIGGDTEVSLDTQYAEDYWSPDTLNDSFASTYLGSSFYNFMNGSTVGDVIADYDFDVSIPSGSSPLLESELSSISSNVTIWIADTATGTNIPFTISELDLTPPRFYGTNLFNNTWTTNYDDIGSLQSDGGSGLLEGDSSHTYEQDPASTNAPAYTNVPALARFEYERLDGGTSAVYMATSTPSNSPVYVKTFLPSGLTDLITNSAPASVSGFKYDPSYSVEPRIVITDLSSARSTLQNQLGFTSPLSADRRVPVYVHFPVYYAKRVWGKPVDTNTYTDAAPPILNPFEDAVGNDNKWTESTTTVSTAVGNLVPRYNSSGSVTSDSPKVIEGDAEWTYERDDSDPTPNPYPLYGDIPLLNRIEYNQGSDGLPQVYLSPYETIIHTYVDLPETLHENILNSPNGFYAGFTLTNNALHVFDPPLNFFTAAGGYVADGNPLFNSNDFVRVEAAVHVPLYYSAPIWGEPEDADTYTNVPSDDPADDPFVSIDNVFIDYIGDDDEWTDAVDAEFNADFISWWWPGGDSDWVPGIAGHPTAGVLPAGTEATPDYWTYEEYTNYLANNYPGDVDGLIARCGNQQYDGPENWLEVDNNQYLPQGSDPLVSAVDMFSDYSLGGYASIKDWWTARYGAASSVPDNIYDVPIVSEWKPELTDWNQEQPVTVTTNVSATGTVVVTTYGSVTHPPDGTTWTYDSPREFDDMASSLYHNPDLGSKSASDMRAYPGDVGPYACAYGGDLRLGEYTSPWGGTIAGEDRGDSNPSSRDPDGGDDVFAMAGPFAYNTHANFGHDAANQLCLEFVTWRQDGESLTTGINPATGLPFPQGGHFMGFGYDWNMAGYLSSADSVQYRRDHRDVNLNGMIDQGETVPDGSHNYLIDADAATTDNGMDTMALFGWERLAEDCVDIYDAVEDFRSAVNFAFPNGVGNESRLVQPTSFSWEVGLKASNTLANAAGAPVLYYDTDGDTNFTPLIDALWIDYNNDGLLGGLEEVVHDPLGIAADDESGVGPFAAFFADVGNTNGVLDIGFDLIWIDDMAGGVAGEFDSEFVLYDGDGSLSPGDGDPGGLRSTNSIYAYPSPTNFRHIWAVTNAYSGPTEVYGSNGVVTIYGGAPGSITGVLWNATINGEIRYVSDERDLGYLPGLAVFIDENGNGEYDADTAISVPANSLSVSYAGLAQTGVLTVAYTTNAFGNFDRPEGVAWRELSSPWDQRNGESTIIETIPPTNNAPGIDISANIQWIDQLDTNGVYNGTYDPIAAIDGVGGEGGETLIGDALFYDYNLDGKFGYGATNRIPLYLVGLYNQIGLAAAGVLHSGNTYAMMTRDGYIEGYNQQQFVGDNMPPALLTHEQGHDTPGWPDLYDYDVSTEEVNNNAASGDLYSDDGLVHGYPDLKFTVGVVRQELNYGSSPILTMDGGVQTLRLYPVERYADQYYLFRDTSNPNEYFTINYNAGNLENTDNPNNEAVSPYVSPISRGIVIGHSDHTRSIYGQPQQQRSNNRFTYLFVQADGLYELEDGVGSLEPADAFGMTPDTCQFTATTIPRAEWYDQTDSGLRILDIRVPSTPYGPCEIDIEWVSTWNGSDPNDLTDWYWVSSGNDSDGDGIPDAWEYYWFGRYPDPLAVAGADTDYDGDGLSDYGEWLARANPTWQSSWSAEVNQQGLSDGYYDADNDGLSNQDEINIFGTLPLNPDTDDDGYLDGDEIHGDKPSTNDNYGVGPQVSSPVESISPHVRRSYVAEGRNIDVPHSDRFAFIGTEDIEIPSPTVTITAPADGAQIDVRFTDVAATIEPAGPDIESVLLYINDRYIEDYGSVESINDTIIINSGENIITVYAIDSAGGVGSDTVTIEGTFARADIRVTQTWNVPGDMDTWLIDPQGRHMGWTSSGPGYPDNVAEQIPGAYLDIDDIPGTGPENITLEEPNYIDGDYEVWMNNYSHSGNPESTVRVLVNEGRSGESYVEFGPQAMPTSDGNGQNPDAWWHVTTISMPSGAMNPPGQPVLPPDDIEAPETGLTAENGWTIESWVKPGDDSQTGAIAAYRAVIDGDTNSMFMVGLTNNQPFVRLRTTGGTVYETTADAVDSNVWTHLAFVYSSSDHTLRLHVNGLLASAKIVLESRDTNYGTLYVDTDVNGTSFSDTLLDEVRVWSVARNGGLIAGAMHSIQQLTSSLVAMYRFDDGGTDIEDSCHALDHTYDLGKGNIPDADRNAKPGQDGDRYTSDDVAFQAAAGPDGENDYVTSMEYAPVMGIIDTDEDGIADWYEDLFGAESSDTNVTTKTLNAGEDLDGDGLLNLFEYHARTNPDDQDSDGDGLIDPEEDFDGDGVANLDEQNMGSDPWLVDTDDDGITDDVESRFGTSSINSLSPHVARALRVTGAANSYVDIPPRMRLALSGWTVSAKVYLEALPTSTASLLAREVQSGQYNYRLGVDTNGVPFVSFTHGAGADVTLSAPALRALPLNAWIKVSASFSTVTGDLRLFIEGTEVAHVNSEKRPKTFGRGPVHHRIGAGINGYIDEVMIDDEAGGAQLHYMFDDGTHTNGVSGEVDFRRGQVEDFASVGSLTNNWTLEWRDAGTLVNATFSLYPDVTMLADTDGDGLSDTWEMANGLNPYDSDTDGDGIRDDLDDNDLDGLNNLFEMYAGTDPNNPQTSAGTYDRDGDADGDTLTNGDEQRFGSHPNKSDTDDDGLTDAEEVADNAGGFTLPNASLSSTNGAGVLALTANTQYVTIPDDERLRLADSWTVEAWVRQDAAFSGDGLIIQRTSGSSVNYELGFDTGRPYVRFVGVYNGGATEQKMMATAALMRYDHWYHLAGVYDLAAGELRLYVDGVAVAMGSVPAEAGAFSSSGSGVSRVGEGFVGQIDEVRIWNRSMSAGELGANAYRTFETAGGPVVYYRFDDFGTTVEDFAGPTEDWLENWIHAGVLVNGAAMMVSDDTPIGATVFVDGNGDGVPDFWAAAVAGAVSASTEAGDDGDGITMQTEYYARLHPAYASTFDDGILDGERDFDGDSLPNYREEELGTRPDKVDTDDDGLGDFEEVAGTKTDGTLVGISDPLNSLDPIIPRGLALDGSSRMVVQPQGRHALTEWTISAWIKPDAGSDGGVVLARTFFDRSVNYELGIENDGGILRPYVRYDSRVAGVKDESLLAQNSAGTVIVNDLYGDFLWVVSDAWTHLAATYSPSNTVLSLYIDGTLTATRTDALLKPFTGAGEGIALAGELTIGGGAMDNSGTTVSNGFEGAIDDVRIAGYATDESGIQQMMGGQLVSRQTDNDATNGTTRTSQSMQDMEPEVIEGEYIVGVMSRDALSPLSASLKAEGVQIRRTYNSIPAMHIKLAEGDNAPTRVRLIQSNEKVRYIEPNYKLKLSALPNDPDFQNLWAMNNDGSNGGVEDADIDAVEAWDQTTGGNVIVAVIDTGVDYGHQDLADNMWVNPGETPGNGVDDDGNGYIDDVNGYDFGSGDSDPMDDLIGHGTHCAGTIGAVGNNGEGVVGVNWKVKIMACKIADDAGGLDLAAAIEAIEYASAMGARVSNNSWGGYGYSQGLYDAIQAAGNNDHLFVAAAANDANDNDQTPAYPASYDLENIISVAATDRRDELANFSNYGLTTVDLGAPGVEILSTLPLAGSQMGTEYGEAQGTSMATPHVAGVAAMILSVDDRLSYASVKDAILNNVDQISALDGKCVTGGRLNLANALPSGGGGDDDGGNAFVRGLAGWFKFDDGGVTAEDISLTSNWADDWRYAGRLEGAAMTNAAALMPFGDSDGDALPDWWEEAFGLDPLDATGDNSADGDPDGDGLYNRFEYLASLGCFANDERGLNPLLADTDNDGVSDAMEDSDGDTIANLNEQNLYMTHPGWADSDDDGDDDGDELTAHTDPADSVSPYETTALTFAGGSEDDNTVVVKDKVYASFTERHSSPEWTIETWVNPDPASLSGVYPLLSRRTYANDRRNYEIGISNGVPYVAFDGVEHGAEVLLPEGFLSINGSNWTHIAATFELGEDGADNVLSLFVDGQLVASSLTGWDSATGPGDLVLGSAGFVGQLSNVRVWRFARPDDQIAGLMDTDLLGGNLGDLAGYLSLSGNGALKETATTKQSNGDGIDMLREDWTLECWVRTTDSGGRLIARRNQSDQTDENFNYCLGLTDDGALIGRFAMEFGVWVDGGIDFIWVSGVDFERNNIIGEIPVNDGQWHHVAYVRDDEFCYLYVDGLLDTKQARIFPPDIDNIFPWPDNYLRVHAEGGPVLFGEELVGDVDEVRIWNRALPTDELIDVKDANLSGAERGLVSYFNFDFQIGDLAAERAVVRNPDFEYGIYLPDATRVSGGNDGPPIIYDPLLSIQGVALNGLFLGNDSGSFIEDLTHRIGIDPYDGWRYAGVGGANVSFADQAPSLWDPNRDSDNDGIPDWWERENGLNVYSADLLANAEYGPHGDPDKDGLSNLAEFLAGTDPFDSDTLGGGFGDYDSRPSAFEPTFGQRFDDGDRIQDSWEILYMDDAPGSLNRGLDPVYYDAHLDPDEDGWTSYGEFLASHSLGKNASPISRASHPTPSLTVHARYNGRYGDSLSDVLAQEEYTETVDQAAADFSYTLQASPITPESFSLRFSIVGTLYVIRDNGEGELVGEGIVAGFIDYNSGAIQITFAADAEGLEFTYTASSQMRIDLSFYRDAAMDGFPIAKYRMASVSSLITKPDEGHLVEGQNYMFGFLDLDGDEDWDPVNEPAGITDFNMGWGNWNEVALSLTDDRQVRGFPRFSWDQVDEAEEPLVTGYSIQAKQGRTVLFTRFIEWPRNYLHEGDFIYAGMDGIGGDGVQDAYTFTIYKNNSVYGLDFSTPHDLAIVIVTNMVTEVPEFVTGHDTSFVYARNDIVWTMDPDATWYQMEFRANGSDAQPDMSAGLLMQTEHLRAPFRTFDGEYRAALPFYAGDVRPDGGSWTNGRYWVRITTGMEYGSTQTSDWRAFNLNLVEPYSNGGKSVITGKLYYFSAHDFFSSMPRATGAVSNRMPVVVQSFNNPGFSGVPDSQFTIDPDDWTNTMYRFEAPFELMGLHADAHYLRAFIDSNTNGVLDTWETWGYGRDPQTYYEPQKVSLEGGGVSRVDDQVVIIRDRDTDTDGLPDIWEYSGYGTPDDDSFLNIYGSEDAGANNLLLASRWQYGLDAFTSVSYVDQNGNGIPDEWELYYYGRLLNAGEASLDSDGDGMSTANEYIAGTDPTNEGESLKVNRLALAGSTPTLSWSGTVNYRVQYADTLSQAWVQDEDLSRYTRVDIGGGAYDWTYTDPTPLLGKSRFYRVVIVDASAPTP